jgi:hypothetical protein
MDEQLAAHPGIAPWRRGIRLTVSLVARVSSFYLSGADLLEKSVVVPSVAIAGEMNCHSYWKAAGLAPHWKQAEEK